MPGVPDLASARGHVGTRTNQGSLTGYINRDIEIKVLKSLTLQRNLISTISWKCAEHQFLGYKRLIVDTG